MDPPKISSSLFTHHRPLLSVPVEVERPSSSSIRISSPPSFSTTSDSSSPSTTSDSTLKPRASTALLGDFTKLHETLITSSPIPKQEETAKLGNFSKLFTSIGIERSEMARKSRQNKASPTTAGAATDSPPFMPAILKRAPSEAKDGSNEVSLDQLIGTISMENVNAPYLETDESLSPVHSDSDQCAATTPSSTPPCPAGNEPSSPVVRVAKTANPSYVTAFNAWPFACSVSGPQPVAVIPQAQSHPILYQLYQGGGYISVNSVPISSSAQKHEALSHKLIDLRSTDAFIATQQPDIAANGVHVFLDMSNINISFQNTFKRLQKIPEHARVQNLPTLNLEFLTELLVRGRDSKALNVGCSVKPGRSEPAFIQQLRNLHYRVDLRERKVVEESPRKYGTPNGYSSDEILYSSGNYPTSPYTPVRYQGHKKRYVEDLVDETLQTRIGESVMKYSDRHGTLIFATGDAKPAKYSDGFWNYADRALEMGWNVEVVSWSCSLSKTWTDESWAGQWGSRFRVINLDDFFEELVA